MMSEEVFEEGVVLQEMLDSLSRAISVRSNPTRFGVAASATRLITQQEVQDIRSVKGDTDFAKVYNIMFSINHLITHQSSQEEVTQKFDELVLLLHNRLNLDNLAMQLTQELKKKRLSYQSPLSKKAGASSGSANEQQVSSQSTLNQAASGVSSPRMETDSPSGGASAEMSEQDLDKIDGATILSANPGRYQGLVEKIIRDFTPENVLKLGQELGLYFPTLKKMSRDSINGEMVHAWLLKMDGVPDVGGDPTWRSFAQGLAGQRMWGAVDTIRNKYPSSLQQ